MATYTDKLKLRKPEQDDFYNINDFNENFDKIDEFAKKTITEDGGTLTGSLKIKQEWSTISLEDNTNRKAIIEKNSAENYMSLYSYGDAENYNAIMIQPETTETEESILFKKVVNGNASVYKIFGEHNLPNATRIQHGTYVGTGDFAESGAVKLTFDFKPLLVIVTPYTQSSTHQVTASFVQGCRYAHYIYTANGENVGGALNVKWEGNSVSWYQENQYNVGHMLNSNGSQYQYVAIG